MSEPTYVEARDPADDTIVAERFASDRDWFGLLKELRMTYNLSIFEAERMVLGHPGWRGWCNTRLKVDARCRKLAWKHIREHGESALFIRHDNEYSVR